MSRKANPILEDGLIVTQIELRFSRGIMHLWRGRKGKRSKDTPREDFGEDCEVSTGILEASVYLEKIPDRGEDAEPLSRYDDNSKRGLIGVFDGLGGAGSAVYEEKDKSAHTGAYRASRLAKKTVEEYFESRLEAESTKNEEAIDFKELETKLGEEFKKTAGELDKNPSKLKSDLIKRLPTTMAAIYLWDNTEDTKEFKCCPIWAGDSRCYLLNTSNGLHQLSEDELISNGDAFENLLNDSRLSNFINADIDFDLRSRTIGVELPCVFLVATDGCFGYLTTPMHFEFLLLRTLQDSQGKKDWEEMLKGEFERIAGDDASMALMAIGWRNFDRFKQAFKRRLDILDNDYIAQLEKITQKIDELTRKTEELEQKKEDYIRQRRELRKDLWEKYKSTYDKTNGVSQ